MNDYKELIKRLRVAVDVHEVKGCVLEISAETCAEIADAIEQLVKERDAAVADIKKNWLCATCSKRIVGKEWGRCEELDYAKNDEGVDICKNYEWRGVSE